MTNNLHPKVNLRFSLNLAQGKARREAVAAPTSTEFAIATESKKKSSLFLGNICMQEHQDKCKKLKESIMKREQEGLSKESKIHRAEQ